MLLLSFLRDAYNNFRLILQKQCHNTFTVCADVWKVALIGVLSLITRSRKIWPLYFRDIINPRNSNLLRCKQLNSGDLFSKIQRSIFYERFLKPCAHLSTATLSYCAGSIINICDTVSQNPEKCYCSTKEDNSISLLSRQKFIEIIGGYDFSHVRQVRIYGLCVFIAFLLV